MKRWSLSELRLSEIEIKEADGTVAIFSVETPSGVVRILAEATEIGRTLKLDAVHIEGPGPNSIGLGNLRVLADLVMETLDYDQIEVHGAGRTTGAFPSEDHRPSFRFARRRPLDV